MFCSKINPGFGQDKHNMWYQYLVSNKLTDKSTLTALAQYRSFDFALDTRVLLTSAQLDYEIYPNVRPAAGFMFLILQSYSNGIENDKTTRYEKRPYQQITFRSDLGHVSASHRFRVEERFLNNPDDLIIRLRYLISLQIPFYKRSENGRYYGLFRNEVRLNAQKRGVFDSNRITAGAGIKFNARSSLEFAFINQLEEGPTSNFGAILFRNNFDWRKKK